MGIRGAVRSLVVAGAVLCASGSVVVAPAVACACGGVVSGDGSARVDSETAVLGWDGRRETVLMRLGMRFAGGDAALIVPTPTPATVSTGSAAAFAELSRLTAPEVVTERHWFDSSDYESSGAAPGSGPEVLGRVQLGPLEATTLRGGDLTGVREWLSANGYQLRPEVSATLDPYLREGWSFVAMRLTSTDPLDGALDPVRLTFDSDRLVYPMRMSAAATTPQSVHLYVFGDQRLTRTDADTESQSTITEFASPVPALTDPDLVTLAAGKTYLTELSISIPRPATITTDFTFAVSPTDAPVRDRVVRKEYVELLGFPAGYVLITVAAAILAVVGGALLRRRSAR
ncbi:DUF2330 domain-containing protein [Nocardia caishijiensis]|uniref:DUF2330 domain-containing protein n=1 Tax=Nocardia caishijiensis TaxID=184756 RepID=A0ABQ6YQA0_9NOCA|nr:DUF2330 domain-containing protein [Nocardia caishijiensis]KAF0847972.1 hypothetical protein FNL39_102113 [Nocardia caishijiensis]